MIENYINKVIQGDCLEVMKHIPDKSIDLILTDPPYGIKADKGIGGFGTSKTDKHYKGGGIIIDLQKNILMKL